MKAIYADIDAAAGILQPGAGFAARDSHAVAANATIAEDVHPTAIGLGAAVYVAMIATFWLAFVAGPMDGIIAMGIVTVVLAAVIAVPGYMAKMGVGFLARHGMPVRPRGSFSDFLNGYVKVDSGVMSARGALTLVISLPLCLLGAAIGMGIVFAMTV